MFTVNPARCGYKGDGSWASSYDGCGLGMIVIKMVRPEETAGSVAESTALLCPRVVH